MITMHRILVPVDFSKESILAVKFGASIAKEYNAKLYILHVKEPIRRTLVRRCSITKSFRKRLTSS